MRYRTTAPSYETAHTRVRAAHGPASDRACVDCGQPASEWSYDHTDENELSREISSWGRRRIVTYSASVEHYEPRCRGCHIKFDRAIWDAHPQVAACVTGKVGTYAGWNEHQRNQTPTCDECRRARTEYMREYRRESQAESH